jgi:hypothetical protein
LQSSIRPFLCGALTAGLDGIRKIGCGWSKSRTPQEPWLAGHRPDWRGRPGDRQAGNSDRLASQRLPPVLDPEVALASQRTAAGLAGVLGWYGDHGRTALALAIAVRRARPLSAVPPAGHAAPRATRRQRSPRAQAAPPGTPLTTDLEAFWSGPKGYDELLKEVAVPGHPVPMASHPGGAGYRASNRT